MKLNEIPRAGSQVAIQVIDWVSALSRHCRHRSTEGQVGGGHLNNSIVHMRDQRNTKRVVFIRLIKMRR